jgi:hypothetical protein
VYEKSGVEFAHWSKLKPGLRDPTASFSALLLLLCPTPGSWEEEQVAKGVNEEEE